MSTAAGFPALVGPIVDLYELPESLTECSKVARQGSGSAYGSLFYGYFAWKVGRAVVGIHSHAVEVAPESHWPDMRAVIPGPVVSPGRMWFLLPLVCNILYNLK